MAVFTIRNVLAPSTPVTADTLDAAKTPARTSYALHYQTSDAQQIIARLADFAGQYGHNPDVIAFAKSLTNDITDNHAQQAQVNRIAGFVLHHVVYLADPRGVEYVQSPVKLIAEYLKQGYTRGDCDDMTLLFASLCNALGLKTRICAVPLPGSDVPNHVLNQVMIRGNWVWFDGCNKANWGQAWENALVMDT